MFTIDNLKCLCTKNKKSNLQCPNKRKDGSLFCGVHIRSKIKTRVDELDIYLKNITEEKEINIKKCKVIGNDNNYYTKEYLLNCNINQLKIGKLRNSIKNYNLLGYIGKNKSKRILYKEIKDYFLLENKYIQNINKIIKIQSVFRLYDIFRRKKSNNDIECIYLMNKYEISPIYFFNYYEEKTKKYFAFDIRTLVEIIKDKEPKNPFTLNNLDINVIKNEIENRIKSGISLDFEEEELNPEITTELRMVDIFHKFDLLGNYTNHKWMYNLNISNLRTLYRKSEDMFNYRIGLTNEQLKLYVKNGLIFKTKLNIIDKIKKIDKLRNIILDEYEKVLNYELSVESDKKTAIMWLLTALTEVSMPARNAMPHLDQGMI